MSSELLASVIVPTHGRRESLLRVLQALRQQNMPSSSFEVLVICDGDVDGSAAACRHLALNLPYPLHVIEQNNQGPAAARNHGVAAAKAPLIVFIDDDVVPDQELIAVHVTAQAGHDRRVTIGPLLPPADFKLSPWAAWEERALCQQYDDMTAGRWKPTVRQFYTGNASVLKHHIVAAGGFDPQYRRAEDVELAFRLRDRDVDFVFLPAARAWHYVQRTYAAWLRMATAYGEADVAMARAGHLEVLGLVPSFFRSRNLPVRKLTQSCVGRPAAMRTIVTLCGLLIKVASVIRFAVLSNVACSLVFNLRYYDGVAASLGGRAAFMALLRGEPETGILQHTTTNTGYSETDRLGATTDHVAL